MHSFEFHGYTPQQRDLVYVTFDPSVGREIQKRRPAIVISSTEFNLRTGYVAICPITSTVRSQYGYVNLHSSRLKGQIVAMQFKTLDFLAADRNIQYVEKANAVDFMKTAEIVENSLGFADIIGNI